MKEKVIKAVIQLLTEKENVIRSQINVAQEAILNETKSSAGDKYETGRAMAQNEIFRLSQQLHELQIDKQSFNAINFDLKSDRIIPGSLIHTEMGWFLLSVGVGKILVDDLKIITLSIHSPLGKTLLKKRQNDTLAVNKNNYRILQVL